MKPSMKNCEVKKSCPFYCSLFHAFFIYFMGIVDSRHKLYGGSAIAIKLIYGNTLLLSIVTDEVHAPLQILFFVRIFVNTIIIVKLLVHKAMLSFRLISAVFRSVFKIRIYLRCKNEH